MKETRFPSMSLPNGFRVGIYSTIDEGNKAAARTDGSNAMLDFANDALVAWGAGSVARKAYVTQLEVLTGIVRKFVNKATKTVGKTTKSYSTTDGGESENKYGARIIALLTTGDTSVKPEAYTALKLTSGKANAEATVLAALQAFADNLVVAPAVIDPTTKAVTTSELRGVFNVDAKEVERTQKEAALAKRYIDAAATIIKNNSQDKWVATFTKENIVFADFKQVAKPGASQEDIDALATVNNTNLALAIKEREDRVRKAAEAKAAATYV